MIDIFFQLHVGSRGLLIEAPTRVSLSRNGGTPIAERFIVENQIEMDDRGTPI